LSAPASIAAFRAASVFSRAAELSTFVASSTLSSTSFTLSSIADGNVSSVFGVEPQDVNVKEKTAANRTVTMIFFQSE